MKNKLLTIVGARENNLKIPSTSLPHNQVVAVTGLSGSGKSSLAFDTVYAEGQRRYIETFSPYTRQFLDKVKKPDVDLIENVRPAIAIQQRVRVTNSRSTVGSMTNINEYLKVLWASLAEPHCPICGDELIAWTPDRLVGQLEKLLKAQHESTFLLGFSAPLGSKKKLQSQEIERLLLLGFSRYFNPETGTTELLEEVKEPVLYQDDQLLLILDRMKPGSFNKRRVRDVIEQAFSRPSPHLMLIESASEKYSLSIYRPFPECQKDGFQLEKARPALFSYNHPYGACPQCKGFGRTIEVDRNLCVPNQSLSIEQHALQCWSGKGTRSEFKDLIAFCKKQNISTSVPWRDLTSAQKDLIFTAKTREYWGVLPWFEWLERKTYKMHVRVFLSRYRSQFVCPSCEGKRLRKDALAYLVGGRSLPELWEIPAQELKTWVDELQTLSNKRRDLSLEVREAVASVGFRVQYLLDLGLPYLTLDRQARTLSGGETQRVNLAAALGSSLTSTHFVLDEPSVGLHPRDTRRLIQSIRKLQQSGNSLLIVEHDLECLESADHIIEMGPHAGTAGGQVVFSGARSEWQGIPRSAPPLSDVPAAERALHISNAHERNLKQLSLSIPLNRFVCLSGVSGSGKSTLAHEVLYKAYQHAFEGKAAQAAVDSISGFDQIEQMIVIDQSPLSKTPRANIATFTGIWDTIRTLLASSPAAERRALTKSSFSFNVDGGRCPHCKGSGFIREDMQFLSDVFIPCEVCLGKRFQPTVLEVTYKDLSADKLLALSVEECGRLFADTPSIAQPAEMLTLLGLGHLSIGHPLSELSGGEAQRLKLVPYVERGKNSRALLVFDEPTTGLHLRDVERLITLFNSLLERGNSILCIEHNLEVLTRCDWLIDLGPEGGDGGGQIMCMGRPKDLLKERNPISETIRYMKEYLAESEKKVITRKKVTAPLQPQVDSISIKGAHEHNLKDVSLEVPLNTLVAFTGVSGSGKSTIAKDIIYAEGQRRYLDCLSPYARQYIKELKRPQVLSIDNIPPTICVYQHTFQPSAHSTVGTMSEVYNFLRLLFAKIAVQHCPDHPDQQIAPASPAEIAESIHRIRAESIRILAPVIKSKKGLHKDIFERAVRSEISEVRVDGIFASPGKFEKGLTKSKVHTIEYVTAKFNPKRMSPDLIQDAVLQALSLSGGTLLIHTGKEEIVLSSERTCPVCQRGFYKPDPEDLSFSSKRGACQSCSGTGVGKQGGVCSSCKGSRLQPAGRNIRLGGKNITELCSYNPRQIIDALENLDLTSHQQALAQPVLRELFSKLQTLCRMGLDYLSLNRDCATLSGGELQRLRLATALGSPLSGVLYIFDEPSIGLHPIDNLPVIEAIRGLKDHGNSVVIIEHDADMIRACDHIIDIGPGGGKHGGTVVYNGPAQSFEDAHTVTSEALAATPVTSCREMKHSVESLSISRGNKNNVRDLSLSIPLQSMVTVAGVSGAGKSSLVHGIIAETLQDGVAKAGLYHSATGEIRSTIPVSKVITIDQKPIGANSRSTPASYLGIWDEIRKLYAATIEAKSRGWTQSFFSYNTGKGRCPECKGLGVIKFEMNFLPDSVIECETCQGKRFSEDALSVLFQDRTISEVLNLTFEEALPLFSHHRKIHHPLHHACELGIGYLSLGQSSTTLSGGESQRIKLVSEISSPRKEHSLYIFDEPTVGLHKVDVARLARVFRSLVALGHSVLIIEHDSDILYASDHVIELGPGAAEKGGQVIFAGKPEKLVGFNSPWGDTLARALKHGQKTGRVSNL